GCNCRDDRWRQRNPRHSMRPHLELPTWWLGGRDVRQRLIVDYKLLCKDLRGAILSDLFFIISLSQNRFYLIKYLICDKIYYKLRRNPCHQLMHLLVLKSGWIMSIPLIRVF